MSVQIKQRSRLRFGELVMVDGVEFWDLLELPDIEKQTDDVNYVVKGQDRIDYLAFRFYGDPILWWVIALANDMELLPTELNEGDTIRIPSPRYVLQVLFRKATN